MYMCRVRGGHSHMLGRAVVFTCGEGARVGGCGVMHVDHVVCHAAGK